MSFGIILLVLVVACSLVGSFVPQGREAGWYLQNYPGIGSLVLTLGLDHLFRTWYFIALVVLLGLNLALCTATRLRFTFKAKQNAFKAASGLEVQALSKEDADRLCLHLASRHYRREEAQGVSLFFKNMAGFYGSFVVHLSFLLVLCSGGLVMGLSQSTDYSMMPGETLVLPDGTSLFLERFRTADDEGRTDYASLIRLTSGDESQSVRREISVNSPLRFRSLKYYQHHYGTGGHITAVDEATGGKDEFYLAERSFLSSDGQNGILFEAVHPGYIKEEGGEIVPLASRGMMPFSDPVYQILVFSEGSSRAMMVFPGETVSAGGISFTFNPPAAYPGIRVKYMPAVLLALLYGSFALMIAGFWLCFFCAPAVIAVRDGGYALAGSQNSGAQLEIDGFLAKLKEGTA
jgi:cytochrome c biogenesis protein